MTSVNQKNSEGGIEISEAADINSLIRSKVIDVFTKFQNAGIKVNVTDIINEVCRLFRETSNFDVSEEQVEKVLGQYIIEELGEVGNDYLSQIQTEA